MTPRQAARAISGILEVLPELTEHQRGVIIHDMSVALHDAGHVFDENAFADYCLNTFMSFSRERPPK